MIPYMVPMEERLANWRDHFAEVTIVEDGFWYRFKRIHHWWKHEWPRTDLARCDRCKRLMRSSSRLYASLPPRHAKDYDYRSFLVCIGCYTPFRLLWNKWELFREIKTAIYKLEREATNARRKANNGPATCEAL